MADSVGYGKAHYSRKRYQIPEEELKWLTERIELLGQCAHEICMAHVEKR